MHGKTRQRRWKWLAGVLVVASGASGCAAPGGAPTVPSGLELAIADGNHVLVVDPANGATLYDVTPYREVKRLAYRPDGARLAVGHCFQNRVAELETGAYTQVAEPITAASCPWAVAYRPDGLDLAALRPFRPDPLAALFGHLTVVGGNPVDQNLGRPLPAMAYRPGGVEIAIATPQGLKVLATTGPYATLHHLPALTAGRLAYTTDGARLLATTAQGLVVLDAAAGYGTLSLEAIGAITALAVDPSGQWLSVATPSAISIRRALDLSEVTSVATTGVRDLAFSRDGTTLATSEADGDVRLFRAPDWVEAAPIVTSDRVAEIAFRPNGGPRLPVLFIHGHSRDPAEVWFEDGGEQAFSKFIAFNPALAIDAFYLKLPLHGNSFPQNQNRSIAEDAEDILAAIEGGLDSHGATQVGILNMPAYQAGGRVAIVAYSQGTLSSRYYAKNLMGSRSGGGVTVSEFVTIAAANNGVGTPLACGDINEMDRARRQLCAGRIGTTATSTAACGSCAQQPPAVFSQNLAGDDTFISDLNGHPFGAATSCDVNFQSALMAPSSRPTSDPTGILYVNLYAAPGFLPPLTGDLFVGGAPQHGDCLGRRVAHNPAPDAINFSFAGVPVDIHANLPHEPDVICTALRTVTDHQAPVNPGQACQGLDLPAP
jgi:hypothetical protein